MDFDAARSAIFARLATGWAASAYAAVPVEYENRLKIDLSAQTAPFIACEVLFNDSRQASIEIAPLSRFYGAIWLASYLKEGEGTADAYKHLGVLSDLFKYASFGGVKCQLPKPVPGHPATGWYICAIRVPFWFDQI